MFTGEVISDKPSQFFSLFKIRTQKLKTLIVTNMKKRGRKEREGEILKPWLGKPRGGDSAFTNYTVIIFHKKGKFLRRRGGELCKYISFIQYICTYRLSHKHA